DTTTIDLNSNKSVLTGNVVITQGLLTIYADRVELENDEITNDLTYVYAIGNPVRMIDTPIADKPPVEVTGHTVEYFPADNMIITIGDARITRSGSKASGERIEYNSFTSVMTIKAKRIISGNPDDKQAELIIEPGDVE
ncbi:MAG: lipopolysaccharide transport periplasmic protein LptA, partial [Reinekea sp.]